MGNRGFGTISLKAGTATRPFRVWRDTCRTGWDKEMNEESLEPGRPHPFTTSAHCAEGTVIPELVFPATQGALRVQLIRARHHSLSRLKHAKGQLKQSPTRPIWSDHDWTTHEIDNSNKLNLKFKQPPKVGVLLVWKHIKCCHQINHKVQNNLSKCEGNVTWPAEPFFRVLDFDAIETDSVHESSKIVVEHALDVAWIQLRIRT